MIDLGKQKIFNPSVNYLKKLLYLGIICTIKNNFK